MFVCTVCGGEFENKDKLNFKIIPIFRYDSNEKIQGWNYNICQCETCLEKLGEPIKILHRPYQFDLAIFSKSDKPVILKGSCPRD